MTRINTDNLSNHAYSLMLLAVREVAQRHSQESVEYRNDGNAEQAIASYETAAILYSILGE